MITHESYFGYSISRKYPFKWFTWAAVIGGLSLTALFSAINVAVVGYDTDVFYTTDPNATESQRFWYDFGPFSWTDKPSSTCQSTNLVTGSDLYTDKLNFAYRITGMQSLVDNHWKTTASIPYHNNVLSSCVVGAIRRTTGPNTIVSMTTFSYESWMAQLETLIQCNISATTTLNLSTTYIPNSEVQKDPITEASLWWGLSTINLYNKQTSTDVNRIRGEIDSKATYNTTLANYYLLARVPSFPRHDNSSDILSDKFFSYGFIIVLQSGVATVFDPSFFNSTTLWTSYDHLAKSFYSTVMADLGQNGSNILTDPGLLQQYTAQLGNRSFDESTKSGTTGPLGITPSTFYMQYLCRVPKLKSTGSLIASVVLANLVYLTAAWKLYNWFALAWLERKESDVMMCHGCMTLHQQYPGTLQQVAVVSPKAETDSSQPLLKSAQPPGVSIRTSYQSNG